LWCYPHFCCLDNAALRRRNVAMQFSKNRHRTRGRPKPGHFGCDASLRSRHADFSALCSLKAKQHNLREENEDARAGRDARPLALRGWSGIAARLASWSTWNRRFRETKSSVYGAVDFMSTVRFSLERR